MKALFLFSLVTLAQAAEPAPASKHFKSFELLCSVSAKNIPGRDELIQETPIAVSLAGPEGSSEGKRFVKRIANYEFWVSTMEVLQDADTIELLSYNAEIRDTKNKLLAGARSSDEITALPGKQTIKQADVKLEQSPVTLSMSCSHKTPLDPQLELRLRR